MIITKLKSYKEIKSNLKKTDKIGIVSCNSCVRRCNTGGEKVMKEFALRLKKDGFNVADMDLIGVACDFDQLKKDELKGDVNIIFACDSGAYNLKKLFPKKKLIHALNTIGLGAYDNKGNFTLVKRVE